MTDFVETIGGVMPAGAVGGGGGVAFSSSRLTNQGRVYSILRLTHPTDGLLTLYLGDIGFSLDDSGWPYVYAGIASWGALSKQMGANDPENEIRLEFIGKAFVVPSNVTKRYRLDELLRVCQMRDSQVDFFQWDAHLSQSLIWRGYWMGMDNGQLRRGTQILSARLSARKRATRVPVSDVVSIATMPAAPPDSLGKMVPRAYGNFLTKLAGGNQWLNDMVFLGYGARGIPGVVIDEQQDSLKQKVRFVKNDGTYGVALMLPGDAAIPAAPFTPTSFFVSIPEANAIGLLDRGSFDLFSTAAEVMILVSPAPRVYVPVRPGEVGSLMHAGLKANAFMATDADPHNFFTTTSTDYTFALTIPPLSISGFAVDYVGLVIDVDGDDTIATGTRTIDWGIWNDQKAAGGGYFGVTGRKVTSTVGVGASRARHILYPPTGAGWYGANDTTNNVGPNTTAEFAEGRFIGRDAGGLETPLQAVISVTSGSKDGVRIFGIGVIVRGTIPVTRTRRVSRTVTTNGFDVQGRTGGKDSRFRINKVVTETEKVPQTNTFEFLAAFDCQQDHGTRFEGGTANESIKNQAGIAFHLCNEVGAKSCNEAAGTLGNFLDARAEDVATEKDIAIAFGPDVVDLDGALKDMQARFPLRVFNDDGVYQCIPDEMNPHSSRLYRSRISARRNIVKDSFRAVELPFDEMRNRVTLNYSHVHGTNRPMKTLTYNHPLSQKQCASFDNPTGVLEDPDAIDEPAISIEILNDVYFSGDQPNALYHARWLGRMKARPRVTTVQLLDQSFYDLRRGHVLEYEDDMEGAGIQPVAYRTGLLDYAFVSSSDGTDYADSAAPRYIAPSGAGEAYWGFSQQISSLTALVATPAGYTTVASGHEWYDGAAWQPHTGVVNPDFLKTAGTQTVSITRPTLSSWKKAELTLGGAVRGPCYWWRMKYTAASNQGLGNGVTTYPAKWIGRLFEVISVNRRLGALRDYPYIDAQLKEVM